jgi:hypothetical protein
VPVVEEVEEVEVPTAVLVIVNVPVLIKVLVEPEVDV